MSGQTITGLQDESSDCTEQQQHWALREDPVVEQSVLGGAEWATEGKISSVCCQVSFLSVVAAAAVEMPSNGVTWNWGSKYGVRPWWPQHSLPSISEQISASQAGKTQNSSENSWKIVFQFRNWTSFSGTGICSTAAAPSLPHQTGESKSRLGNLHDPTNWSTEFASFFGDILAAANGFCKNGRNPFHFQGCRVFTSDKLGRYLMYCWPQKQGSVSNFMSLERNVSTWELEN